VSRDGVVMSAPLTDQARRGAWLVAALALCVYLATAGGSLTSVDAVMTYEVTKNLVTEGSAAFDRPGLNHHPGVDGRFYSPFGIGQSIYNIPFYVVAHGAQRVLGVRIGKPDTLEKAGVALGSAVAAAGAVWLVYLFAFRLTGDLDIALITALAAGFATLVWPYSKFGFNQALTTWSLTGGVYTAWIGVRLDRPRVLASSGVWLGCALLTRHEMAVPAAMVAVWIAIESRTTRGVFVRRLLWFGVPRAAALVVWLAYNQWRFGSPFETGNLGPESIDEQRFMFSWSTVVGIAGLLFSPGRSLFLYTPLAAAGLVALPILARRDRSLAWLFAALMTACLVLYGSLRYWDGLRGYGPRYLVPLLPIAVVPVACWMRAASPSIRRALVAFIWISAVVQLPGVVVDYSKVSVDHASATGDYSRDAKIDRLSESALVLDSRAMVRAVPANIRNVVRGARPAPATPVDDQDTSFAQRFSFSLDFWWLYLYYFGVLSAPLAVALGVAPLVAAWLLLRCVPRGRVPSGASS
jgi:hypothetical protein